MSFGIQLFDFVVNHPGLASYVQALFCFTVVRAAAGCWPRRPAAIPATTPTAEGSLPGGCPRYPPGIKLTTVISAEEPVYVAAGGRPVFKRDPRRTPRVYVRRQLCPKPTPVRCSETSQIRRACSRC